MKYHIKSIWAGKYAHTYQGLTNSLPLAIWWFVSWSILEAMRVLKLNHYHYGNIFGIGRKLSDEFGRKNKVSSI